MDDWQKQYVDFINGLINDSVELKLLRQEHSILQDVLEKNEPVYGQVMAATEAWNGAFRRERERANRLEKERDEAREWARKFYAKYLHECKRKRFRLVLE